MFRNKWSILFYVIIGFGVIGLFSQLFTQPLKFLTGIFLTVLVGLAIFAIIYYIFIQNKAPSDEMKKYRKAVRQSKAKYNKDNPYQKTSANKLHRKPNLIKKNRNRRSASHLRVIDGNKTKRKDRASF